MGSISSQMADSCPACFSMDKYTVWFLGGFFLQLVGILLTCVALMLALKEMAMHIRLLAMVEGICSWLERLGEFKCMYIVLSKLIVGCLQTHCEFRWQNCVELIIWVHHLFSATYGKTSFLSSSSLSWGCICGSINKSIVSGAKHGLSERGECLLYLCNSSEALTKKAGNTLLLYY